MMERMLKLSVSSVRASPTAASSASAPAFDASPRGANGRSLLNDALSPSGRRILQDFLDDDERVRRDSSVAMARQTQSPVYASQGESSIRSPSSYIRFSPAARDSTVRLSSSVFDLTSPNSKSTSSFVRIQCNTRPFCLKLVEERGEMVVTGFVPDLRSGAQRGVVERSGLVLPGDVLVAVNDEVDALTSVQTTVDALMDAQLPAVLTFRRVPVVKARLGDYTVADIARNLELRSSGSALLRSRTVDDAALLVRAMVDVLDCASAATSLVTFIARVEKLLLPPAPALNDADARARRIERLEQLMYAIHRVVDAQQKEQLRKWNADKASQSKRIDVMAKQRASIDKKLEAMRANPELLNPENHATWQAYVELRHLSHQMRDSVERAKREHYLPDMEHYRLRLGSDGLYVGIGDIWVPSFYAKFTLETRAQAPHVFVHVSTPATHGLKLRAKNFTLSTEGRLPSFHCDELNLEAQLIADVPLVYDAILGWRVPPDELHVKLMSLAYYERTAESTKKGQNHDMVMKMLINRVLPSLVRHAVQNVLCGELGPLLESRNAQVVLAGEIKIQGTKLALYDAALDANGGANTPKERALAAEARELLGMSHHDATTLCAVFKALTDAAPAKKKAFSFAPMLLAAEPKRLSIRSLQNHFAQFEALPHHRALAIELWSQMMELFASPSGAPSPGRSAVEASASSSTGTTSFRAIVDAMDVLNAYPVDVSVSLLDLTFRLDLCEGAATYYTSLQRILRQEMDSVSVGLSNLDSMRDGTFLEHELAKLDDQYERISRILAYITTNVDDCGAVFRGHMPAGFRSKLSLEATDVACKGPCGGTFTIPLTDLAQLQRGSVAVDANRPNNDSKSKAMASALTHEDGALVFSKFFLPSHRSDERAGASEDDETSSSRSASDKDAPDAMSLTELPRDRLQVRVKNTSVRVLFELPSDRSALDTATTAFVPFSLALVTSDDADEPPQLRVETGEFAKCQYKAEHVGVSGTAWQFLKRTKASAGHVLQPTDSNNTDDDAQGDSTADASETEDSRSVWEEYVESPFLRLQFLFFTSCQVTREHMFWSIKSASLAEPKVAHVKHRVCLVQLLQDAKSLGRKLRDESPARQRARQRYRAAEAAAAHRRGRSLSISSTVSDRETLFSHASFADTNDDDFDRLSESMHSTDAYDAVDESSAFNGIEAFEEENSGDESDSDESDEDSDRDDVDDRFHVSPAKPDDSVTNQTNGAANSSNSEADEDGDDYKNDANKSEPEAAQAIWEQRFEREVSDVSTSDAAPKTTTGAPLHKQTSVFF